MFKIKHAFILAVTVVALSIAGCKSRFEKIRLSNDVAKKYQEAIRLYNKKDYSKALILFEDLSQKYRGRAEAEDLNYYYAYTLYRLKDYTTARFQFKYFADTYPTSKNAEECRYMGAFCYYQDSPEFTLDQENTYKAIDALQLFINLYPKSERVAQASQYISDLRNKLELKAYTNARLYYDLGGFQMANYKSSVISLKNGEIDYPDIKYIEEMDLLIVRSQYEYARNSYPFRQETRYSEAIGYANDFIEKYPESKYLAEAKELKKDSEAGIVKAKEIIALEANQIAKYKALIEKDAKKDSLARTPIIK
ncbi:outer membrane protein assembly factor BamD [Pedobacter sp. AW31-3R]|uniref:outer membrane protein assembly factor BamD n=1 Tax=Pedobacter sp. AW31-3R TaxID=3445781 RepID=UPI003F9ED651